MVTIPKGLPYRFPIQMAAGNQQCQQQNRRHVVQRDSTDEDQRQRAAGGAAAVDVLQQRHTQQRLAAPVARLDELRPEGTVPQKGGQPKQQEDGRQGYPKAEQDHTAVPDRVEVLLRQAFEQLHRQGQFENKRIQIAGKCVIEQRRLPMEHIAQHHHQKHRHGGVEAEDQIFRVLHILSEENRLLLEGGFPHFLIS